MKSFNLKIFGLVWAFAISSISFHHNISLFEDEYFIIQIRRVRIPYGDRGGLIRYIKNNAGAGIFYLSKLLEEFSGSGLTEGDIRTVFKQLILQSEIPVFVELVDPDTGELTGIFKDRDLIHRAPGNWFRTIQIICVDEESKILIQLRRPIGDRPILWDFVGATVYVGENSGETAERIMKRELGITPDLERLKTVREPWAFKIIGNPSIEGYEAPTNDLFLYHTGEGYYNSEYSTLMIYFLNDAEKEKIITGSVAEENRFVDIFEEATSVTDHPSRYVPDILRYLYSKDTADEVFANMLLNYYDIGNIKSTQRIPFGRGLHDRLILVEADDGRYIVGHTDKSDAEILFEITFLRFFKEKGIPFKTPLRNNVNNRLFEELNYFVDFGNKRYMVFDYIEGEIVMSSRERLTPTRVISGTRMLANFHWEGLDFRPHGSYARRLWGFDTDTLRRKLEKINKATDEAVARGELPADNRGVLWFRKNYDFLMSQLDKIDRSFTLEQYEALPVGPVHGDYNRHNLVFRGDDVVGILDYEEIGMDSRLVDIICWAISTRSNPASFDMNEFKTIISAYQSVNRLAPQEINALPPLLRYQTISRLVNILYNATYLMGYDSLASEYGFGQIDDELESIILIGSNVALYHFFNMQLTTLMAIDEQDWPAFISWAIRP